MSLWGHSIAEGMQRKAEKDLLISEAGFGRQKAQAATRLADNSQEAEEMALDVLDLQRMDWSARAILRSRGRMLLMRVVWRYCTCS